MLSSAQLSLANTTEPSGNLPMHRGRKPCGSRTAISLLGERITSEYAPSSAVHGAGNGLLDAIAA